MPNVEPPATAGRNIGLAAPRAEQGNVLFAAAWMMGALASFAAMAIAGREISRELDTFQLMFFRSMIGLLLVVGISGFLPGGLRSFKTQRFKLHVVRNLFHFAGQFAWFYSITMISLAEVFALEFTSPIWVAILAPLALKEHMTKGRALAVFLGFVGVMIVLRPGLAEFGPGHIAMLVGALAFATSMLTTKKLSATESPLTILFWMVVIQAPMGLIGSLSHFVLPSMTTTIWLFVVGLCGFSAHYCIAQSFRWADATVVAPMDFFRLPLIAVVGMLFYNEVFDPFVLLGGVVILTGNYLNIRHEQKRVALAGAAPVLDPTASVDGVDHPPR
ncbi:MAG: EamA family transporter [Rhodospirillaceae bacterium]|jgi:drug/metabolite transporter (DMT)-like permease|uniref:DMT family transporter n=1 Tax=Hwanghaeella sp. 1Z406 TaxID=3402811 RepID=UPI000C4F50D1|nr:EamA family transporter [Rhodospirillales bacterium]MAX46638.1 EamA family transporter [Rhodospirillaceae bacterium]|tara:strand:- start:108389 stop:109381 length:993 start_codon:yes stop_codon:yes gene_type:complete